MIILEQSILFNTQSRIQQKQHKGNINITIIIIIVTTIDNHLNYPTLLHRSDENGYDDDL